MNWQLTLKGSMKSQLSRQLKIDILSADKVGDYSIAQSSDLNFF